MMVFISLSRLTYHVALCNVFRCICWILAIWMGNVSILFAQEQHSIARIWNEGTLEAIRHDLSRPTVHARNLFHTSVVMYDAWSVYDKAAEPYLLGKTLNGYTSSFKEFTPHGDIEASRRAAISYAAYRLLSHRFRHSPQADSTQMMLDSIMHDLGYDISFTSTKYDDGDGRSLGNYIAVQMIQYGLQDGANEENDYKNKVYKPKNGLKSMSFRGNRNLKDPNFWQPLLISDGADKNGSPLDGSANFLSPEWGKVAPFSLSESSKVVRRKDGIDFSIYHDPGPPPYLDTTNATSTSDYQWGFMLVAMWSSHLDPSDHTTWDISPASIGNMNTDEWPADFTEMRDFYKEDGGDPSPGHSINPVTGQPYPTNEVLRADYTRVLAEFWADGPDSETPPGHWYTIMNYVADHPDFERKYRGQGDPLDRLEWDIKSYFILGGAMHDAAIAAWSIKGYYDYIRPISAIRYMAEMGQSSDPELPRYHQFGMPIIGGYAIPVDKNDPLALNNAVSQDMKLYTWRGHQYIDDPKTDIAGVGWILAKDWWPYQRVDFVTPPFAGYVSGHSTFSRTAAEVLTKITGSAYFPGGMGIFNAKKNKYLKYENGPTQDLQLQWATYRDASDQCSLSRIWGGIHPPADDIPGRRIGLKISENVVEHAEKYFNKEIAEVIDLTASKQMVVSPTTATSGSPITIKFYHKGTFDIEIKDLNNKTVYRDQHRLNRKTKLTLPKNLHSGEYNVIIKNGNRNYYHKINVLTP